MLQHPFLSSLIPLPPHLTYSLPHFLFITSSLITPHSFISHSPPLHLSPCTPSPQVLLSANPDLENTTKEGDTALLRAVRNKNAEVVQLLVDKKAKVNVVDKKGDTALHIAMRGRSKVGDKKWFGKMRRWILGGKRDDSVLLMTPRWGWGCGQWWRMVVRY